MKLIQLFHERVGHLVEGNIWDKEFPKIKIDENNRGQVIRYSSKHIGRGTVKFAMGRIPTDEEREIKRQTMIDKKFP